MTQPTSNTTVITSLGLNTDQFNAAVDAAAKAVESFDKRFAAVASQLQTRLDTLAQGFTTFASAATGVRSTLEDTTKIFRSARDAAKTYSTAIGGLADAVKKTESTFARTNTVLTNLDAKIVATGSAFLSLEAIIKQIDFLRLNSNIQSLALSLDTVGKTKAGAALKKISDALSGLPKESRSIGQVFRSVAKGFERLNSAAQNNNLSVATTALQNFVTALNGLQTGPGLGNLQQITQAAQGAATALQAAARAAQALGAAPRLTGALNSANRVQATQAAAQGAVAQGGGPVGSRNALSLRRTVQEIKDTEKAVKVLGGETRSFAGLFRSAFGELERPVARLRIGLLNLRTLFGFLGGSFVFKQITESAAEFETQIARIQTILQDTSTVSIKQYAQNLQNLAETTSKNIVDLTSSAYIALSAGLPSDDSSRGVLSVVAEGAKLATAGLATAPNATEAIVTLLNAYGDANLTAAQAAQNLQQTVVVGRTTIDQLGRSYGRVAAIASQFGISNLETSAALGEITRVVPRTSEAITQLRSLILGIARATPATQRRLSELAETLGRPELATLFSARSIQQRGLFGVLKELNSAVGNSGDIIARLFPNVRALVGGAVLSSRGLRGFQQSLARFENETDPVGRGVRALEPTFAERKGRATNTIRNVIDRVGEGILPNIATAFERFAASIVANEGTITSVVDKIVTGFLALTKAIVTFSKTFFDSTLVSAFGSALSTFTRIVGEVEGVASALANIAALLIGSKILGSLRKFFVFLATYAAQLQAQRAAASTALLAGRSAVGGTAASTQPRFLGVGSSGAPIPNPAYVPPVAPIVAGFGSQAKSAAGSIVKTVGTQFARVQNAIVAGVSAVGRGLLGLLTFLNPAIIVASLGALLAGIISDSIEAAERKVAAEQIAKIDQARVDANRAARDAGFTDFADLERQRQGLRRGEGIESLRRDDIARVTNRGIIASGDPNRAEVGQNLLQIFERFANATGARRARDRAEFEASPEDFQLDDPSTPFGKAYADLTAVIQAQAGTQALLAADIVGYRARVLEELSALQAPTGGAAIDSVRSLLTEYLDGVFQGLDVSSTAKNDLTEAIASGFADNLTVDEIGALVERELAKSGLALSDSVAAGVKTAAQTSFTQAQQQFEQLGRGLLDDYLNSAFSGLDITDEFKGRLTEAITNGLSDGLALDGVGSLVARLITEEVARTESDIPTNVADAVVAAAQSSFSEARKKYEQIGAQIAQTVVVPPKLDPNALNEVATEASKVIANALRGGVDGFGPALTKAVEDARKKGLDRVDTTVATEAGITDAIANPRLAPILERFFAVANEQEQANIETEALINKAAETLNNAQQRQVDLQTQLVEALTTEVGAERADRFVDRLRTRANLQPNQPLTAANPAELVLNPGLDADLLTESGTAVDAINAFARGLKDVSDVARIAQADLATLTPRLDEGLARARSRLAQLNDAFREIFSGLVEEARAREVEGALKRSSGQRVRETEVNVDQTLRGLERQVQDQILANAKEQISAAERLQELLVKRLQTSQALSGASVDAADAAERVRADLQIQLETEQKQLQALQSQRKVQQELARLTGLRSVEDFAQAADNLERQARQSSTRSGEANTGKTRNALQASELARQSGIYLRAAERARELLAQFGAGAGEALASSLAKTTDELEKQALESVKKIQDLSIQVRLQPIIRRQEIEAQIRQATSAVSRISLDIGRDLLNVQKELSTLQLAQIDRQEAGLRQLLELTGGYNKDIFEAERQIREIAAQNQLAERETDLNRQQRAAETAQQRFDLEQQQAILEAQLAGDANLLKVLTASDSKLAQIDASLQDLPQRLADVIVPPKRLDKGSAQAQGIIAGLPTTASPIPSLFRNTGAPSVTIDSPNVSDIGALPGTDAAQNLEVLQRQKESIAKQLEALDRREALLVKAEEVAAERRALEAQNALTALEQVRSGVPITNLIKSTLIDAFSFGSEALKDAIVGTLKDGSEGLSNALVRGGKTLVLGLGNLFNGLTSQLGRLLSEPIDALGESFTAPLDNLFGALGGALNAILGFNRPDAANSSIPQVLQDGRFGDLSFNEQQRVLDQIKQQEAFRNQQEAGQGDGPQTAAEAGVEAFEQLFAQAVDAINAIAEVFPQIFRDFLERLIAQLPDLIATLSEVVGEGIGILIAKLPEIILSIVEGLFKGVGGFFSGLVGGIFHDGGRVQPHMRNRGAANMFAQQGAAGFQFGGYVSGQNSLSQAVASRISQDDVVALLQPGERVVSNGEQSRIGGPGALEAMLNNGPNPTRNVPVPVPVGGGNSGRIDSLSPQAAKQIAQAFRDALGNSTMRISR